MIRLFAVFILIISVSSIQAFAEPIPYEEFMKTYQPILDRVQQENLPPTKQSEIGILFNDIFCDDNKIPVLKLTGVNYIACTTPESATKLVERGWGLIHKDDPLDGMRGAECINWWIIHHKDNDAPLESSLIKTIRTTTSEFANESVVWKPIKLVEHKGNTITISSYGNFQEIYLEQVIANLLNIKHVTDVEFKPRACI